MGGDQEPDLGHVGLRCPEDIREEVLCRELHMGCRGESSIEMAFLAVTRCEVPWGMSVATEEKRSQTKPFGAVMLRHQASVSPSVKWESKPESPHKGCRRGHVRPCMCYARIKHLIRKGTGKRTIDTDCFKIK